MKKILLTAFTSLTILSVSNAQSLPNNSFEQWRSDTSYNDLLGFAKDTAYTITPAQWTTTNSFTDGRLIGKRLCTKDTMTFHTGAASIKMTTDSAKVSLSLGSLEFNCPGFAINGTFKINLAQYLGGSANNINFANTPGAGVPVSGRKGKIGGYLKYLPVGGDSATVVAVLRKGTTLVATASYYRTTTDAGFTYFEAPFIYQSCLIPDTLTYLISSGTPQQLTNLVNQQPTGLHAGSTLYADSVFVADTTSSFAIPPFAVDDTISTFVGATKTIPVTANDYDCNNRSIGLMGISGPNPKHGTAVVSGNSFTYIPNAGYIGNDTFSYSISAGGQADTATVIVRVRGSNAISELAGTELKIYPNPVSSVLHLTVNNRLAKKAVVYDMLGTVINSTPLTIDASVIDMANAANGMYIIQIMNEDGKTISTSKFTVVR